MMKNQGNMTVLKETNKTPTIDPKEIETYKKSKNSGEPS